MSRKEPENERPKIYVTSRGVRYVKAEELLTSKRGREAVKKMAAFAESLHTSKSSPPKKDDGP